MPSADPIAAAPADPLARPPAATELPADASSPPPLSALAKLRLAAEVLAMYAEVRWRLWRGDLRSTTSALRDRVPDHQPVEPGPESHRQGVRLASAVTRTLAVLPTDSRCLMQSLVLTGLLSRRGIGSVLVVAVKSDPGFAAHAWVEHGARPLLPRGDYGRLLEL